MVYFKKLSTVLRKPFFCAGGRRSIFELRNTFCCQLSLWRGGLVPGGRRRGWTPTLNETRMLAGNFESNP